jgi:hypothetical protein
LRRHHQYLRQVVKRRTAASSTLSSAIAVRSANVRASVSATAFGADTIAVTNRGINMFTAAVNYKFGRWGY